MRRVGLEDEHAPFSSISQCTLEKGMMSSRPFNLRTMSARCAHGQAYETSRTQASTVSKMQCSSSVPSPQRTEMIPPLLGRELGARLAANEVAERARLALELARLVGPVGDASALFLAVGRFLCGSNWSESPHPHPWIITTALHPWFWRLLST